MCALFDGQFTGSEPNHHNPNCATHWTVKRPFQTFGNNLVANNEGTLISTQVHQYSVAQCESFCDATVGCHSFSMCHGHMCALFDGRFTGVEAVHTHPDCTTHWTMTSYAVQYAYLTGQYMVAVNQLNSIGQTVEGTVSQCQASCDQKVGCHSFTYCEGVDAGGLNRPCYLQDARFSGGE